jgi:uncharacterized membrane protein
MNTLRDLLLVTATVLTGALLGAGLYDQFVMAPNYGTNIPTSLEHLRQFMSVANPGSLFRVLAPAAQITLLLALILNWGLRTRRWFILAAFLLVITGDVVTFTYHYPRNAILFTDPMNMPVGVLTKAAVDWSYGNIARCCLILVANILVIFAGMRCHGTDLRNTAKP